MCAKERFSLISLEFFILLFLFKRLSSSGIFELESSPTSNNKKIKGFTNWKPKYSLTDGLIETIKWNIKTYSKNKITKK